MLKYKKKTFLYYFNERNIVWKIPTEIKLLLYFLLNIFVLINTVYIINLAISIGFFLILLAIGFVKYRKNILKLLTVSLFLFFFISLTLQLFRSRTDLMDSNGIINEIVFIFEFFSKWLLINLSGLLIFTIISQEELISFLLRIKLDFKIIVSITIAFNLIARLIETLEDINISLKSRGIKGKRLGTLFLKIKYTFTSMLLDNIEYISSLRATYAYDYAEMKGKYGK